MVSDHKSKIIRLKNQKYSMPLIFNFEFYARVAKLVDALCSGRSVRKDVLVRIQSWAQRPRNLLRGFLFWQRCELVRKSGQN